MGSVKPWQIVVMILAVIAVGAMAVYSCTGESRTPSQATEVNLVDIRTGQFYVAKYPDKRPVSFPAKLSDAQDATLYPAKFKDNKWVLNTRYMPEIRRDKSLKPDLIVDPKSGELKLENTKPTRIEPFGK
jgi:hypothetical protein